MRFTDHGVDVEPVGLAHGVDPGFPMNSAGGMLAYALCGKAVRVLPQREFDPNAPDAHNDCAARLHRG